MTEKRNRKHADTVAARAAGFLDEASGAVVPPIQQSTTFARDESYALVNPENSYGRDNNDQVRLAEKILCELEGGEETLLFASGMAAIAAVLSSLRRGKRLLLQRGCYWGSTAYIRDYCNRSEILLEVADSSDTHSFVQHISDFKPDLVIVETPSNPWIEVCDVGMISVATKSVGACLMVDATAATPVLMQPLSMGADLVIHSATKAINGHTDVLAGVLSVADPSTEVWQHVKAERHGAGAILSPNSAWLLVRGMRTLPLRIERMCHNAMAVATFLEGHAQVEEVWYPGLASHKAHALASEQMAGGYGYLLSFLVKGGRDKALAFCGYLRGIHRATSLGGVESLVEHRHTIEGDLTGCPENLIRLSVGIENEKDLISELDEALSKL